LSRSTGVGLRRALESGWLPRRPVVPGIEWPHEPLEQRRFW
jgi:hypothetical protein